MLGVTLFLFAITARAATFSTDEKGVNIDAGTMGTFVLEYPTLYGANGSEVHKIIGKEASGQTATAPIC